MKQMQHSNLFQEKIIQKERTPITSKNEPKEHNSEILQETAKCKSPRPQVSLFLPQCQLTLGHLWEEAALIVAE